MFHSGQVHPPEIFFEVDLYFAGAAMMSIFKLMRAVPPGRISSRFDSLGKFGSALLSEPVWEIGERRAF